MKKWGASEYWGVSSDYDPDWVLTEKQKKLRDDLIEVCRVKIRPLAARCDKEYLFPREALNALAELGLLGLLVPRELGGLGENHVFMAVIVETIARYGCPSTAMIYTMHLTGCTMLLGCYRDHALARDLLSRMNNERLVGTFVVSDPATGGHHWAMLSSKTKILDSDTVQIFKYAAWVTSAGHADFYVLSAASPGADGDVTSVSSFVVFKDEARANTEDWSALGMHGNMSGPMVIDDKFSLDRMLFSGETYNKIYGETAFIFQLASAASYSGIALACMDVAKKHVTRKAHADVGMRVCDYPTIQNYFGEAICDINSMRGLMYLVSQAVDEDTNNGEWTSEFKRIKYRHWLWQVKFLSSRTSARVSDTMLHACGGAGYKTEMGLERLLRDSKAGWVMALSNESARQFLGKTILNGMENFDIWEQHANERVMHNEMKKMSVTQKKKLARSLLEEVEIEENGAQYKHPFQESDFENPLNTCPPAVHDKVITTSDGKTHAAALRPDVWLPLKLKSQTFVTEKMASYVFDLPRDSDHTGCLPGQYVAVKMATNGKEQLRYFSPVSRPDDFGRIELVLKLETHGVMSQHFQSLKPGDEVSFQGPCGGFEYLPNRLDELTVLASGGGITPGLQIIRSILHNPQDRTTINLLYYSENYDEILFREELDKYRAQDGRLRVMYTLGEPPEGWEWEEGFIDTAMIDKYVTKPNGARHQIVLCGGPAMTISALHSLRSLGYPSHHMFLYGMLGAEMVKTVYGRNARLSSHLCGVDD